VEIKEEINKEVLMKKILILAMLYLFAVGDAWAIFGIKTTVQKATKDIVSNTQQGLANLSSRIDKVETNINTQLQVQTNVMTQIPISLRNQMDNMTNTLSAKIQLGSDNSTSAGRDVINDPRITLLLIACNFVTVIGFLLMMSKYTTTNKALKDKDKWAEYLLQEKNNYKNRLLVKEVK